MFFAISSFTNYSAGSLHLEAEGTSYFFVCLFVPNSLESTPFQNTLA